MDKEIEKLTDGKEATELYTERKRETKERMEGQRNEGRKERDIREERNLEKNIVDSKESRELKAERKSIRRGRQTEMRPEGKKGREEVRDLQ